MTYLSGAAFLSWNILEVAPVTGSTTTVPSLFNGVFYTNPGTIAAQTLVLPASPQHGDMCNISTLAAITALTLSPVPVGAPTAMTAGQATTLRYSSNLPGWYVHR